LRLRDVDANVNCRDRTLGQDFRSALCVKLKVSCCPVDETDILSVEVCPELGKMAAFRRARVLSEANTAALVCSEEIGRAASSTAHQLDQVDGAKIEPCAVRNVKLWAAREKSPSSKFELTLHNRLARSPRPLDFSRSAPSHFHHIAALHTFRTMRHPTCLRLAGAIQPWKIRISSSTHSRLGRPEKLLSALPWGGSLGHLRPTNTSHGSHFSQLASKSLEVSCKSALSQCIS
jgi:hypothetical protein